MSGPEPAGRDDMKPRERIDRRKKTYLTLVAAGFAVMALLSFAEKHMPAELFKPLLYGALALFLVGNILMYIGIRCPKCKAMLGYHIVFSAGKAHQCPGCRTEFDEDLP